MPDVLQRLKDRKLVQWAGAYVAFAFALLQGVDIVAQRFTWPAPIERILIVVLVLGFPVAVVVAWYHGERGAQHLSGGEISILAALFAIGGIILWQFARSDTAVRDTPATVRHPTTPTPRLATEASPIPAKSIAVLPFENLSGDKGNAYFADGMQDLILTKLADIGGLKVVSRLSTANLASHPDDLAMIGQRLGVATFLEGSVQKAGRQVLINVQLIDAKSDAHVWAQSYTRTLDNIFGVEGEVAQKVAAALDVKLTGSEAEAVSVPPTHNEQAYDDFLRGRYFENEAFKGAFAEYLPQAITALEKAVAEDPGFALAWAELSGVRTEARYFGADRSESNLVAAEVAAKRSLALAPNLADAHVAMAGIDRFLYHDFKKNLAEDELAANLRPNYGDAIDDISVSDAHLGDLDGSLVAMRRRIALDPADFFPEYQLGLFLTIGGRYAGARAALHKALALNPQSADTYVLLSRVAVLQDGDVGAATALLDGMAPGTPINASVTARRVELLLYRRQFGAARELARDDAGRFTTGPSAVTLAMSRAAVEWMAGRKDAARALYRTAIHFVTAPGSDLGSIDHMALGLAYARLGQAEAAMREDGIAASIDAHSHDVGYIEAQRVYNLARIRLALGDAAGAIKQLEHCLARGDCGLDTSPAQLRVDPIWDAVRNDRRFQALWRQ